MIRSFSFWLGVGVFAIGCADDPAARDASVDAASRADVRAGADAAISDAARDMDAGPDMDAGTVVDAGAGTDTESPVDARVTTDAEADTAEASCGEYFGTYLVGDVPGNPSLCGSFPLSSCTAMDAGAGSMILVCDEATTECTLDEDCVCTGTFTISRIEATVVADFSAGTATVSGLGQVCGYTLTMTK